MRVIFRGEEKRRQARMEREASLIHRETLNHLDESDDVEEEGASEEALLEELIQREEEEIFALLAAREEAEEGTVADHGMEDVVMSDIDFD
jgi:aminoglycoside phosphotransferase